MLNATDFQKRGGFTAEVDESLFLEAKNNKRILHFRSLKFPARTLQEALPDSMPVDEFNLQSHLDMLVANQNTVDEFAL